MRVCRKTFIKRQDFVKRYFNATVRIIQKMKKNLLLICFPCLIGALIILTGIACAEEIKFEASANRNIVSLGQGLQLGLQFRDSKGIPAPELPAINGFKSRYIGPSTMMSIVNGRMSSSVTHIYRLIPLKTGRFRIGPLSFKYKGDTYISNSLTIQVVDSAAGRGALHGSGQRTETDLKDRVFVRMQAGKSRVYINEIIPLTIKLYINSLGIRNIQYPEFSHEGFSAEGFGKPLQYRETIDGTAYDVIEFRTKIFATKTGELKLGPAKLQANLIIKKQRRRPASQFNDFFGRDAFDDFFGGYSTEPVELNSGNIALTVMPLPKDKRPPDFSGAVGDFDLSVEASPDEIKAGDPLTLKMTITGDGNFNTVTAPKLKSSVDFKVYKPQAKQDEDGKIFEQILIPLSDAVKEIPEVNFSFFDIAKGEYHTISKGPFPVTVLKPEKKEEITLMEAPHAAERTFAKENFGRDIIYIKESPGRLKDKDSYLYMNTVFLLMQTIPFLLFVSLRKMRKRKERLRRDIGYARRLSAPQKAKKGIRKAEYYLNTNRTGDFYDSIFTTLREYIGNRFHLPSGGITADIVDNALKDKDIDEDVLTGLRNMFKECDMARYASAGLRRADMENTLKDLKQLIDYLERHKL